MTRSSTSSGAKLDSKAILDFVGSTWDGTIVPALSEYIRIPNKSPHFDPRLGGARPHGPGRGADRGLVPRARRSRACTVEVVRLRGPHAGDLHGDPGRRATTRCCSTATSTSSPRWRAGARAWARGSRCCEGDKLYGRGGADDGYAAFASLTAIEALQRAGRPARALRGPDRGLRGERQLRPARSTSSTSPTRIGTPSLVVCLDSGCGNYEQLWGTTSLRGIVVGDLTRRGADRGRALRRRAAASCPRASASLRQLLSRLEDDDDRRRSGRATSTSRSRPSASRRRAPAAEVLGDDVCTQVPLRRRACGRCATDRAELVLNRTWRPALVDHRRRRPARARRRRQRAAPAAPRSSSRCACRRRSTPRRATQALKEILEADPPYGAQGDASTPSRPAAAGTRRRSRPGSSESLRRGLAAPSSASRPCYMGEGGSIPFMGMLGERFPRGAVPDHRRARPAARTPTARTSSCTSRWASA